MSESEKAPPKVLRFFASSTVQSALGILFSVLAIGTLFFSYQATVKERDQQHRLEVYIKCQGEWTNFFYLAINNNRNASQDASAALDDLVQTVSTAPSREAVAAALQRYKDARAKQIQAQEQNPLPEAPKDVCQLEDS